MKKHWYKNTIALFIALLTLTSCKKNIFGPNEGVLSGVVRDNNGVALEGAKITATYTDGTNTGSVSVSSDETGFYELERVRLSENEVNVTATGFQADTRIIYLDQKNNSATFNFTLNGAPVLSSINLSNNILDQAQGSSDSIITLTVNVQDSYNSVSLTNYVVSAIIKDSNNNVDQIIMLNAKSNSSTLFILDTTLSATQFNLGLYTMDFEITDPDGNTILRSNQASFSVI